MSLLSAFLENQLNESDDWLSDAAHASISKSVFPLHQYNIGEITHVKFGWNCATYASAVSIAKRYLVQRYEAINMEVSRADDLFLREFTISFIRND